MTGADDEKKEENKIKSLFILHDDTRPNAFPIHKISRKLSYSKADMEVLSSSNLPLEKNKLEFSEEFVSESITSAESR